MARYLRLDPQTVSRKAQRGEIPGIKIGNRWRFRKEEIEESLRGKVTRDPFESLRRYLQTRSEVELVYLFGSRGREEASADSDTDLAVLFRADTNARVEDQIIVEMGGQVDGKSDIVSLRRGSPLLKYEVVSEGKIIHQRLSEEAIARFELGVYREYFHMERARRLQFEALGT